MVIKSLVAGSKHPLRHFSAAIYVMGAINKDLRLNYGYKTILLTNNGIASKSPGILDYRKF